MDRGVTVAYGVFPPFYYDLAAVEGYEPDLLSRLRVLATAASPKEIGWIRTLFPRATQVSVYGSTDLSGTVCLNLLDDSRRSERTPGGPGRRGRGQRPRPHGAPVQQGAQGEFWFRDHCVLSHYDGIDEDPRDADGWFHTGEQGFLDPDGNLAYRGRLKDMLKVGGENVAPVEIEDPHRVGMAEVCDEDRQAGAAEHLR